MSNLEVEIEGIYSTLYKTINNNIEEYPLKLNGYNIKIFVGKFSSNNSDDIYIYGETGGSGGYAIALVYKYNNEHYLERMRVALLS